MLKICPCAKFNSVIVVCNSLDFIFKKINKCKGKHFCLISFMAQVDFVFCEVFSTLSCLLCFVVVPFKPCYPSEVYDQYVTFLTKAQNFCESIYLF